MYLKIMRRKDREVTDFNEIADILRRSPVVHLGLSDEPFPYVVPLSFGTEIADGKISIIIHGARLGRKIDLLKKNPRVSVEAEIFHRYMPTDGSMTALYESVIGEGTAGFLTDSAAVDGLKRILAHCGYEGYAFDPAVINHTAVIKITLESFSGKKNLPADEC
jgi:nitroimidazol reductase NimA-like FMN-containing flavoprotein (pyridoxamine 5'-phosphate oxidase superfamily)